MAISETLAKQKMSLADFLSLPEDDSSPVKYELEFGELVEVTRPTWEHNELIFALGALLQQYVRSHRLG
jgi:Uma2 family endonuclease